MRATPESRAGFYVYSTLKLRFLPTFTGSGGITTELEPAYEFYLLSADGRAYRNSGWGFVTAKNIDQFDFDETETREPENVGSYTDETDHLIIRIQDQTLVATITGTGALRIGASTFERTGFE